MEPNMKIITEMPRPRPFSEAGASRCLLLGLLLATLVAGGCASTKKIDWDARIGSYTYDQAILDLGPPDKKETLSDGRQVAEWMTARVQSPGFMIFEPGYYYRHPVGGYMYHSYYPTETRWFLRLVFDAEGMLQDYRQFTR